MFSNGAFGEIVEIDAVYPIFLAIILVLTLLWQFAIIKKEYRKETGISDKMVFHDTHLFS